MCKEWYVNNENLKHPCANLKCLPFHVLFKGGGGVFSLVTKRSKYLGVCPLYFLATFLLNFENKHKLNVEGTTLDKQVSIQSFNAKLIDFFSVSCGTPFLTHGNFTGTDFTVGGRISFKCDAGYKLVGVSKTSKCKKDGKWSNVKPTCKSMLVSRFS